MFVKQKIIIASSLMLIFSLSGCLKPPTEKVANLTEVMTLNTIGYCREVKVRDSLAIVAADEAGIEIWSLGNLISGTQPPTMLTHIDSIQPGSPMKQFRNVFRVDYSARNKRLFGVERNSKVFPISVFDFDSLQFDLETMSSYTNDFLVLDSDTPGIPDSAYVLIAADQDDGLKVQSYEYTSIFGVWGWYESAFLSYEIQTLGVPNAIDYEDGIIAMGNTQTGVTLYNLDLSSRTITPSWNIDVPYSATDVSLRYPYLFIAADDAGMIVYDISGTQPEKVAQVGDLLGAGGIGIHGDWAILTMGNDGIAIYNIQDPTDPKAMGIFDIGYAYAATFANDYLLVSTREGLKIFTLTE